MQMSGLINRMVYLCTVRKIYKFVAVGKGFGSG